MPSSLEQIERGHPCATGQQSILINFGLCFLIILVSDYVSFNQCLEPLVSDYVSMGKGLRSPVQRRSPYMAFQDKELQCHEAGLGGRSQLEKLFASEETTLRSVRALALGISFAGRSTVDLR